MANGVTWEHRNGVLVPVRDGTAVTWAAQPGAQEAFMECPVAEVLLEGNRAGGKTDALLMDFCQHVGQGWGAEWHGVLFRKTRPQLKDVVKKSKKWIPRIWPFATFNSTEYIWTWPTGEQLKFSYMRTTDDYEHHHGAAYPWIAWEELTTWADDECYTAMMSTWRSSQPGMPRKYRATTNPHGPGHNWVRHRFKLPIRFGDTVGPLIQEPDTPDRVVIHSDLSQNKIFLEAEPDYIEKLKAAARNPAELRAWLYGDWDIVSGGMFDDLWAPQFHVIPNLPFNLIPKGWKLNRSYDHGQSKPFSVGWWAESNGEPMRLEDGRTVGRVPGDLIRIAEWYGCTGKPNEGLRMLSRDIGIGIREREADWGLEGRVSPGPADSSIFDDFEPGKSVAGDMKAQGVKWIPADKGPGSRVHGWSQVRNRLAGAIPGIEGSREEPGLFICERCKDCIRTVPVLPRSDKNPDDVDTEAEEHIADELRYRVRAKRAKKMKSAEWNEPITERKTKKKNWSF